MSKNRVNPVVPAQVMVAARASTLDRNEGRKRENPMLTPSEQKLLKHLSENDCGSLAELGMKICFHYVALCDLSNDKAQWDLFAAKDLLAAASADILVAVGLMFPHHRKQLVKMKIEGELEAIQEKPSPLGESGDQSKGAK